MRFPRTPKWMLFVCLLALVSLACNLVSQATPLPEATPVLPESPAPVETEDAPPTNPPPEPPATQEPSLPPVELPEDVYAPAFAGYQVEPVSLPQSFAGDYTLPLDLSTVQGMDLLALTPQQLDLLAKNGFVVAAPVPGQYREFYQVYESQRYQLDQPLFITTDSVYHVYHLIFDKMLRDLERDSFIPALELLTDALLRASQEQYQTLTGTPLEEPARRNMAFFAAAARLLEMQTPTPPEAADLVEAELALIDDHAGAAISPIWDRPDLPEDKKLIEDYSQYIPRGHYTRSEALKRYFKAMMWYGRLNFRLRDDFETQRALLITDALRKAQAANGQTALELWQNIYEPTVFIVGKADDLSYFEYGAIADAVFGKNADPRAFGDPALLAQFSEAARKLPPPQVNSMWVWIWEDKTEATQGFRFMGQRFTLDQYVFGQMIWRNVGTMDNPRGLPKALDFFAALGSDEALGILREIGEDQYANFDTQMEKVRSDVASLELDSWTQNLYWSWLYSFFPLLEPKDARYPAFMQTQAWLRKDLQTAASSWTELKHDTILYAKQVMAEMGGGEPPEPPRGYVEPQPEVYARLLALAQMTESGLAGRGLLSPQTQVNLENLTDVLQFLKSASEKELAGQPLTDEETWRIQYFGGVLESFTLAAADCDDDPATGGCRNLEDQKAALIADVATGLGSGGELVALEEAIGQPAEIYVVLPDAPYRIGVGAVFTYYEFPVPVGERMTDEAWQAQVEGGTNPPQPDWTKAFISP